MAISVFPAGGGEFVTNDFVVDMNNTENNVIDLGRSYAAGSYEISLASGDSSFDIYAIDADGASVGYTNNATLIASAAYTQLVILGVATDEKITFAFAGNVSNPTTEGNAVGAGAYLDGISPFDLPSIDDTATVTGGNFATDVEIYFESGTVSTEAKNVTRNDATELIVTRPDALDPALDPWDVKAINPGITPPTGSNAHILAGTVDAGATPVWVSTSPLAAGTVGVAYSEVVSATDADGSITYSVVSGALPAGLTLDGSTGTISGTPTARGDAFTLQATDDGGNSNTREFTIPITVATGGSVSTDGNYTVHTFTSSDDFVTFDNLDVEYLVIAGGGGGGSAQFNGAGGGAGGYRSSIAGEISGGGAASESTLSLTAGTVAVTVGAGGGVNADGADSVFSNITSIGGGRGAAGNNGASGGDGGSGGGGAATGNSGIFSTPGSGTAGQGFDGFFGNANTGGSGGGAGSLPPNQGTPGNGVTSSVTGTSVEYAKGGPRGADNQANRPTTAGSGGGGQDASGNVQFGASGGISGLVVVRYE